MDNTQNNQGNEKSQLDLALETIQALKKNAELYELLNAKLEKEIAEKNATPTRAIHQWIRSKMKNSKLNELAQDGIETTSVAFSEENEEQKSDINNAMKVEPTFVQEAPKYIQVETRPEYRTLPLPKEEPMIADNNPYINATHNKAIKNAEKQEVFNQKVSQVAEKVKSKFTQFKNLLAEMIPHIDEGYHLETNNLTEPTTENVAQTEKSKEKKPSKLANLVYKLGFKLGNLTQKQKDILPTVQEASMAFVAKANNAFLSLESTKEFFTFRGHKSAVVQAYKNAKDYFDVLGISAEDLYKNDNSYLNNLKNVPDLIKDTREKLTKIGFDKDDMNQGMLSFKSLDGETSKTKDEILEKMVMPQLYQELSKIFAFKQEISNMLNRDPYILKLKEAARESGISHTSLAVALRSNENLFKAQIKNSDYFIKNKEQIIDAMDKYEVVLNSVSILRDAYCASISSLKENMSKDVAQKVDKQEFQVGNKQMPLSEILANAEKSSVITNIEKIRERKTQASTNPNSPNRPKMSA